jgi:hypothetical protein
MKNFLTNSLARSDSDGFGTKTWLVAIHMKISWKMKSTQGIPIYVKILIATRRWRSKEIFNSLHQPEDKNK